MCLSMWPLDTNMVSKRTARQLLPVEAEHGARMRYVEKLQDTKEPFLTCFTYRKFIFFKPASKKCRTSTSLHTLKRPSWLAVYTFTNCHMAATAASVPTLWHLRAPAPLPNHQSFLSLFHLLFTRPPFFPRHHQAIITLHHLNTCNFLLLPAFFLDQLPTALSVLSATQLPSSPNHLSLVAPSQTPLPPRPFASTAASTPLL
jgi:hypothetical protein